MRTLLWPLHQSTCRRPFNKVGTDLLITIVVTRNHTMASWSSLFIANHSHSKNSSLTQACDRVTFLLQDIFYSRKNFERPELQLKPYRSFKQVSSLVVSQIRKPLNFGVYWFLNYENRLSGSKVMTEKPTEIGNFLECPNFWPNILNWVYFRQYLSESLGSFFKYIPNWTKNYKKIFVFLFNASFRFWVNFWPNFGHFSTKNV